MNISINKLREEVEKALLEKDRCLKQMSTSTGKKYELYKEKFNAINEKYWLLQEKLDYYESDTIGTDDEIVLKRFTKNIDDMYSIYLKDEVIKIGHIDYRGYHDSSITGDISYVIDSNYRGHNYAYKALVLLSDYLYKNNIPDFYISVFLDNVASLKIILKAITSYGGDIVSLNGNMITFICETKKIYKTK